jgi:hypothetical protein
MAPNLQLLQLAHQVPDGRHMLLHINPCKHNAWALTSGWRPTPVLPAQLQQGLSSSLLRGCLLLPHSTFRPHLKQLLCC